MSTDGDAVGVSRRGVLALVAAAGTAGCMSSGSATEATESEKPHSLSVSLGFWSAQKLSTETFEPIPGEFVHQVSVGLHNPHPDVQKVEFTIFADPTPLMASWKLPEQADESRNLGENVYGETVHAGEGTFEAGDPWEARAFTADDQWIVQEGTVPENEHESE